MSIFVNRDDKISGEFDWGEFVRRIELCIREAVLALENTKQAFQSGKVGNIRKDLTRLVEDSGKWATDDMRLKMFTLGLEKAISDIEETKDDFWSKQLKEIRENFIELLQEIKNYYPDK
jgi:hypothetical protein